MKIFLWIVIAGLILIAMVRVWMWYVCRKVARNIVQQCKAIYGSQNEWEVISDPKVYFDHSFDHDFYDTASAWLTAHGFRELGSIVNRTMTRVLPNPETYLKIFANVDSQIIAACFVTQDLSKQGSTPSIITSLEFETCLSDGSVICTSPKSPAAKLDSIPGIHRKFVAEGTSFEQTLAAHHEHLIEILERRPRANELSIPTIEDVIEMQHRQHEKSMAYRRENGWVTMSELKRMAPQLPPNFLEDIMRHVQRLS